MGDREIDWLEVVKGVMESGRHVENRAWNSLGHYLVANAFIIAALAQFHGGLSVDSFGLLEGLVALLAFLGYVTGIQWALLGSRNWQYALAYSAWLDTVRDKPACETARTLAGVVVGVRDAVQKKSGNRLPIGLHHIVLTSVPTLMSVIYLWFGVVLVWSRGGIAAGLGTVALSIGAVYLVGVIICYKQAESRRTEIP